ncbi:Kinesin motor domain containing protein [Reticulomyxa filosa]|uniref:Kinesin motor domain containing protein n=1 Tax=Reticulomyxa filosa TaxID=46433 RepID=X6MJ72_RETFI|nr:Kinesin motor domain containing protein [Reticulomyxa filosa]|eukprot:ETO13879.1 Kinesin motor domain containing protein [Reticulomyxa filosa]
MTGCEFELKLKNFSQSAALFKNDFKTLVSFEELTKENKTSVQLNNKKRETKFNSGRGGAGASRNSAQESATSLAKTSIFLFQMKYIQISSTFQNKIFLQCSKEKCENKYEEKLKTTAGNNIIWLVRLSAFLKNLSISIFFSQERIDNDISLYFFDLSVRLKSMLDESTVPELEEQLAVLSEKIKGLTHISDCKEHELEVLAEHLKGIRDGLINEYQTTTKKQTEHLNEVSSIVVKLNTKIEEKETKFNELVNESKNQMQKFDIICQENEQLCRSLELLKNENAGLDEAIDEVQEQLHDKEREFKNLENRHKHFDDMFCQLTKVEENTTEDNTLSQRVIDEWKSGWNDICLNKKLKEEVLSSMSLFFVEMDTVIHNLSDELATVKHHLQETIEETEKSKLPKYEKLDVDSFVLADIEQMDKTHLLCNVSGNP